MMKVNVLLLALLLGLFGLPNVAFGQAPVPEPGTEIGTDPGTDPGVDELPVVFDWVINKGATTITVDDLCSPSRPLDGCSFWPEDGWDVSLPIVEDETINDTTWYRPFYFILESETTLVIEVTPYQDPYNQWHFEMSGDNRGYNFKEVANNVVRVSTAAGGFVTQFSLLPNCNGDSPVCINMTDLTCGYLFYTMLPCREANEAPNPTTPLQASPTNNGTMRPTTSKNQSANPTSTTSWTAVNPLSDNLVLTFDAPLPAATLVQVYNMNGGLVHRGVVAADVTQINLAAAHWTPGIYAVSVNHAGGSQQKLVVKQ